MPGVTEDRAIQSPPPREDHHYNLKTNLCSPHHITPTTLRPDIVWWDDSKRKIFMVELTIAFETSFSTAAERKRVKYEELEQQATQAGYNTNLITLEVGSRGMIHSPGLQSLKDQLKIKEQDLSAM